MHDFCAHFGRRVLSGPFAGWLGAVSHAHVAVTLQFRGACTGGHRRSVPEPTGPCGCFVAELQVFFRDFFFLILLSTIKVSAFQSLCV